MQEYINSDAGFDEQEELIKFGVNEFEIQYIALHSSYDESKKPTNIDLEQYVDQDDRAILHSIFCQHLNVIWKAREGGNTRTGFFNDGAALEQSQAKIKQDETKFFEEAQTIAKNFRAEASKVRSSQGILVILRFQRMQQKYLAIFKMNLGELENIALLDSEETFKVKVNHIVNSLPQPGKEVLKWVIVPHPTLNHVHLKYKDRQNPKEPAAYFTDFLGCRKRENEKSQIGSVMKKIQNVFVVAGASSLVAPILVASVLERLKENRGQITEDIIVKTVNEIGIEQSLRTDVLNDRIKLELSNQEIDITPETAKTTGIRIHLKDEDITIQGPADRLLRFVETTEGTDSNFRWTITIHTNGEVVSRYV